MRAPSRLSKTFRETQGRNFGPLRSLAELEADQAASKGQGKRRNKGPHRGGTRK